MSDDIKPIIFDLKDVRKKAENGDKFACYILGRSYDSEENGIRECYEFAILTNEIYQAWSGMKASEYKDYKNF